MKFLSRKSLIVLHDLFATAAAIVAAFYLRFEASGIAERLDLLLILVPGIMIYAGFVYSFFHLDDAKWRFASAARLSTIFSDRSRYFAVSLLVLDYILLAPKSLRHLLLR
jgi:O-antigen biosynthesis protein WbqV